MTAGPQYVDGKYVPERRGNLLVQTHRGGRILSAFQLPWFTVLPPEGYGVITTTGRRTGKARRRCVRAIRRGDRAYLVSIPGARGRWLNNIRANPEVRLRIRGGTVSGRAHELLQATEKQEARTIFCETLVPFDYLSCGIHRRGRPTRSKIEELISAWFEGGIPLVVELRPTAIPGPRA
jgi:deazaflavin-dependent oxidoreductase (nitroreductase family)